MAADLPDSILRNLDPAQVRWYAVQSGWKLVNGVKRPVILLNHPTDDLAQIQIPTAGSDKEIAFLMGEAVRQLAEYEQRPAREVLADLSMPPADVLRLRVQAREAESGTMPLDDGIKLIQGGRDMLLAAACSAHQPQPFFRSQSFGPAQEFLRSCRIGQTERSSYVATIIAPITPELSRSLFDGIAQEPTPENEPYERRVTLLLMQALQTLRGSLDRSRSDEILRAVSQGVSANLCDALASISPPGTNANVQISMSWSRTRPKVPQQVQNRVMFAQSEFPILREAGRRLKNVESRRVRVEGPIIGLQAEPAELFEDFLGSVTIRSLVEGRSARVRFQLKQQQYIEACNAHRDRRSVSITGMLHGDAQSRLFDLIIPEDFRVLPPDTPTSSGTTST
jgi:hypothetical protein